MATVASAVLPEERDGTTTFWLPLTTAFPYVEGCSSAFFNYPGVPEPFGFDPGYGYFAGGTQRCLPGAVTTWYESNHAGITDGFTSVSIQPIVCPAAHTTAATEVRSGSSTLVMCCPSDYGVVNGEPGRAVGQCKSSISAGQVITYTASKTQGWVLTTTSYGSATNINAVPIRGWNVARASSTSSPNNSTGTLQDSSAQSNSSLSTGAKAGIGIGVALAVIGLATLVAGLLMMRRSKRTSGPVTYSNGNDGPMQELSGKPAPVLMGSHEKPVELEYNPRSVEIGQAYR